MKKSLNRKFIAAILAVTFALGGGVLVAKSIQPKSEIVLAEGEETEETTDPEEPGETIEPEEPGEGSVDAETSQGEGEQAPATTDANSTTVSTSTSTEGLPKSVIKALLKTLRDALKDLIAHIKRWFGIK